MGIGERIFARELKEPALLKEPTGDQSSAAAIEGARSRHGAQYNRMMGDWARQLPNPPPRDRRPKEIRPSQPT